MNRLVFVANNNLMCGCGVVARVESLGNSGHPMAVACPRCDKAAIECGCSPVKS